MHRIDTIQRANKNDGANGGAKMRALSLKLFAGLLGSLLAVFIAAGTGPAQPPIDLLRPFPAEQMTAWKVDKAVGNVGNDRAQLLETPPEEPMLGFVADPQQP